MQLNFKKRRVENSRDEDSLASLRHGEQAVLESLDVPDDLGLRLMELGFFPGGTVIAAGSAPGGDPRVFRVDGSEIALRGETARRMKVRRISCSENPSDLS